MAHMIRKQIYIRRRQPTIGAMDLTGSPPDKRNPPAMATQSVYDF